jgi:hypothetical protein
MLETAFDGLDDTASKLPIWTIELQKWGEEKTYVDGALFSPAENTEPQIRPSWLDIILCYFTT